MSKAEQACIDIYSDYVYEEAIIQNNSVYRAWKIGEGLSTKPNKCLDKDCGWCYKFQTKYQSGCVGEVNFII